MRNETDGRVEVVLLRHAKQRAEIQKAVLRPEQRVIDHHGSKRLDRSPALIAGEIPQSHCVGDKPGKVVGQWSVTSCHVQVREFLPRNEYSSHSPFSYEHDERLIVNQDLRLDEADGGRGSKHMIVSRICTSKGEAGKRSAELACILRTSVGRSAIHRFNGLPEAAG